MRAREWRTWRVAMAEALYGPQGFYRTSGAPGRHFRTAAHTSPAWAGAIRRLIDRVDDELGKPDGFTVVDLGAGGGELIGALAAAAPDRWRLVGVDLAPRPADLPAAVEWAIEPPPAFDGALIAVEWLDVIPVDVVELTANGLRVLEVDGTGQERLGEPPTGADEEWLARWWPLADVGDRAEIGLPRDDAWEGALGRLRRGVALAVDYAVDTHRDVAGTLTGFASGRQVLPVPDGSMDITSHVLFESLPTTNAEVRQLTQRDALLELGLRGSRPAYSGNPREYVAALSRAGAEAELLARGGLGEHRWLLARREMPPAMIDPGDC